MTKLRAISWASVSSLPQAAEDKISIDEQLRLNADWCAANNAEITDTLVIPGHSRYESDLIALLDDYARQGIWAYHRIREHWQTRDFDILICYHDSRFGRSSTTYNYVAENVIRAGARIYRITGGWLDAGNMQFGLALGSIAATTGVAQLVQGRKMGMKKRAQRGLPTSSGIPMTHTLVRDELGNAIRMVVDESKRRLWDDLYRVYVEQRVSYRRIERVLYEHYGHAAVTGYAYQINRFYTLLTNPTTHGHSAQHYRHDHKFAGIGPWIFKPDYPVPDGVTIHYNTHDPVWQGSQFERIFEEFTRRQSLRKGGGSRAHAFTGLILCAECGYNLLYNNGRYSNGLRCMSHYNVSATRPDCTQNKWIHEGKIRDWLTPRLEDLIKSRDWSSLLQTPTATHDIQREMDTIRAEINQVNAQIIRMIEDQSLQASPAVVTLYQDKIKSAGDRLDILHNRLDELNLQAATSEHSTQQRAYALDELARVSVARFWQRPGDEINQLLHRLMGNRRLEVYDGQIIATREAPPYRRTSK